MKKTNFAIIGFGSIGKRHKQRIEENQDANLFGVCDIKYSEIEKINNQNLIKTLDYKELLTFKEIDVVCVTSPNGLHASMSIDSLNAGKHVVCEKPMALSVLDCNKMILAAERNNRKLFIVKQNRFNPPVIKVRELLQSNILGRIFSVNVNCFWNRNEAYYRNSDWKGTKKLDGGTLYTQFSHFIDIVYNLFGDFSSVYAKGVNSNHPYIEFEDTGAVLFELACGALGTINYSTCAHKRNFEGSITIFAENGTIKIGGEYLNTIEYFNIIGIDEIILPQGNQSNDYGFYKGSMSNHDHIIANVVNTLNGKEVVATSAFEGMKIVQIIETIYESMKSEKRLKIQ